MTKFFVTVFLAIGAMIIATLLITYTISQAFADIQCEYRTVTERDASGSVSTTQKEICVERTINGKSAPTVSTAPTKVYRSEPLTELEKKIRKPGCYRKDPDGYIVADPQCPAWIAYLREIDQRNGLVPYSTRKHNRFKKDLFGAVLTLMFSR